MKAAVSNDGKKAKSHVINVARHLFATRGFHQTSMAELAEEAHISVGAIYRSFKGKADIIQAIVEEDAHGRLDYLMLLSAQVKDGTVSIDMALNQLTLRALSDDEKALSFEILAEAYRNGEVADTIAAKCVHYRALFRDLACAVNPQLTATELDAAEELLLACLFGLGHRTLSNPHLGTAETADYTARMIHHALNALHPPAAERALQGAGGAAGR